MKAILTCGNTSAHSTENLLRLLRVSIWYRDGDIAPCKILNDVVAEIGCIMSTPLNIEVDDRWQVQLLRRSPCHCYEVLDALVWHVQEGLLILYSEAGNGGD
jgi:hypothetical protein